MPRTPFRNKDFHRGLRNRTNGLFKKADTFHKFYPGYDIAVIIRPRNVTHKAKGYFSCPEAMMKITDSEVDFVGPDDFVTVADRSKSGGYLEDTEDSSGCSTPESTSSELPHQSSTLPLRLARPAQRNNAAGSVSDTTPDTSPSMTPSPPPVAQPRLRGMNARRKLRQSLQRSSLKDTRQRGVILAALNDIV